MAQVQILFVATVDGVHQLANPGKSDRWRLVGDALVGEPIRAVVASPSDPLLAYAASGHGLAETIDGGVSWTLVQPRPAAALVFGVDGSLYAGLDDGSILMRSTDGAWTSIFQFPLAPRRLVAVGAEIAAVTDDGTVWRGHDHEWQTVPDWRAPFAAIAASTNHPGQLYGVVAGALRAPGAILPLELAPTGPLAVLPSKTETLLLATAQGIARFHDGTARILPVVGPQGVHVLRNPAHFVDWAYAGTDSGEIWVTKDRGATWNQVHSGLPSINDLSFVRVL